MELLLILLALAGFWTLRRLKERADRLEARLALVETQLGLAGGPAISPLSAPDTAAAPDVPPPSEGDTDAMPVERPATVPPIAGPPLPKPARPGLEERLGTRWAVWVGGLALALGGVLLVRYSIEQGLLGPGARVTLGALFALALIAAGEIMRRRKGAPVEGAAVAAALDGEAVVGGPSGASRAPSIPAVLTAAGTSTAFATVFAAHALYDLIGPTLAFVLLGAVALATMAAAALHGPALAALGLVAALGAPVLVSSPQPQVWPLVPYLGFVVLAAYGVARLRLWRWLALCAAAGALAWSFVLTIGEEGPAMAHLVVQLVLAGAFLVADPHRRAESDGARTDRFATVILFGFTLFGVFVGGLVPNTSQPLFAGLMASILIGLGLRFAPVAGGVAAAELLGLGILALWPIRRELAGEAQRTVPDLLGDPGRPEAVESYLLFALALFGAAALGAVWRVARSGRTLALPAAAWYAGAATVGPLLALVVVYWRIAALDRSLSFALVAGLLALAFTLVAAFLRRGGAENDALDGRSLTLGATASAAVAALALGLTFALDKGMLTVAFALAGLGTAWVARAVGLPALRYAVAGVGLVVLARLVYDPTIVGGDPGRTLVFNWLLWGYGVPALAFLAAIRILERLSSGRDWTVRLVESLGLAFAGFLVFFEIRHALQGGDPLAAVTDHLEVGLVATASLLFALILVRTDRSRPDTVYRVATYVFGAVALGSAVLGLALATNPLFTGEPILGGVAFNSLLPAYLIPALLSLALARQAQGVRPDLYVRIAAGTGLLLGSLYGLLAIRRVFHGPIVDLALETGQGEQWAYSLGLLGTGITLLAIGFARESRTARLVSGAFVMAAVFKVFVIDLANLEGVMRALSFIGLGLALVGIGLAYQRLLARRAPA